MNMNRRNLLGTMAVAPVVAMVPFAAEAELSQSLDARIPYVAEEMKKAGYIFNGMQLYDHLRVLEICSAMAMYFHVRVEGNLRDEAVFRASVKEAIARMDRYKAFDADCRYNPGDRAVYSKKTGQVITEDMRKRFGLIHSSYPELSAAGEQIQTYE